MSYLVDSNVLLRLVYRRDAMHTDAQNAYTILREEDRALIIVPQNLIEFWAVATRPVSANGLGLTVEEAAHESSLLKELLTLKPDTPAIHTTWEKLVVTYQVKGKQVHDTRLVAAMVVHQITHLLTFNTAREKFQHILIDCPPSLGLLTVNALAAADALLIPVQCQFFALKGLEALLETVGSVKKRLNPRLKILGVLPTMAEKNTVMTQDVINTLKQQLEGIRVFDPVPKSVKFAESNLAGEPIHLYAGEWKLVQPYRVVIKQMVAES